MGIITDESFRDLHALRKIRDDFAHVSYGITFETPAIKSRCSQLRSTAEDATTPRVQFLSAAQRITGEVLEAALESRLSLAP